MARLSKRMKRLSETVEAGKAYPIDEAIALVKSFQSCRFIEAVEVSVNLGVDPKRSDQVVRGSTVMPHGLGKNVRVAVFVPPDRADQALEAGADLVGLEDLAERVRGGELGFDVAIASPDAMRVVGQLGQILGPRGLMPNPKVGTVTMDVVGAIGKAKAGQVQYRVDRGGIVHCSVGRTDFELQSLKGNLEALLSDLSKAKPAAAKGIYFQKISLATTMGLGVMVEKSSLAL